MGTASSKQRSLIAWAPFSEPQRQLLICPADEIFFGGARGGGKTDGMLGKFANKQKRYGAACVGVFFRRTREDLKEAIERSRDIYGPMGAQWHEQKKQWTFPSGARLKFEYLDRDQDAQNYQGHSYTDLFFEELTNWPDPTPINKLRATLRSAHGVPCQFHATGNPGGPGHQWVKARYIDPNPSGYEILWDTFTNPFTGEAERLSRVFIPSKLTDNPTLMADPAYVARLHQSGTEQLVRAWLHGDWDIVEGAFFDCWSHARNVIRPLKIPEDWPRFRSMDWGAARPFSVGWWAIVSDWHKTDDGVWLPRGAIVRYREWYGVKRNEDGTPKPDVGLKMTAEDVGKGIRAREADDPKMRNSVIDPAAFDASSGPSIHERMFVGSGKKVSFIKADNKRTAGRGHMGGWNQMYARIKGEAFDEPYGNCPMLFVFTTCTDFIRTVPVLQHDERNPEDIDTDSEDHAGDEARYACMSRPYVPKGKAEAEDKVIVVGGRSTVTLDDLWAEARRERGERV